MNKDQIFKRQIEILLKLHELLDEEQLLWLNFVIDDESRSGYCAASTQSGVHHQSGTMSEKSEMHKVISNRVSKVSLEDLEYPEENE